VLFFLCLREIIELTCTVVTRRISLGYVGLAVSRRRPRSSGEMAGDALRRCASPLSCTPMALALRAQAGVALAWPLLPPKQFRMGGHDHDADNRATRNFLKFLAPPATFLALRHAPRVQSDAKCLRVWQRNCPIMEWLKAITIRKEASKH